MSMLKFNNEDGVKTYSDNICDLKVVDKRSLTTK